MTVRERTSEELAWVLAMWEAITSRLMDLVNYRNLLVKTFALFERFPTIRARLVTDAGLPSILIRVANHANQLLMEATGTETTGTRLQRLAAIRARQTVCDHMTEEGAQAWRHFSSPQSYGHMRKCKKCDLRQLQVTQGGRAQFVDWPEGKTAAQLRSSLSSGSSSALTARQALPTPTSAPGALNSLRRPRPSSPGAASNHTTSTGYMMVDALNVDQAHFPDNGAGM